MSRIQEARTMLREMVDGMDENTFDDIGRAVDYRVQPQYCPECAGECFKVFRENIYGDIVGCSSCAEFIAFDEALSPPLLCPNCAEPTYGNDILFTNTGAALACSCCCGGDLL